MTNNNLLYSDRRSSGQASECSREVQLFSSFRLAALCSWQAIWKSGISRRLSAHQSRRRLKLPLPMSKKEPPRSFGRPANLTIPELEQSKTALLSMLPLHIRVGAINTSSTSFKEWSSAGCWSETRYSLACGKTMCQASKRPNDTSGASKSLKQLSMIDFESHSQNDAA